LLGSKPRAFPFLAAPARDEVIDGEGAGAKDQDDHRGEEKEERCSGKKIVGVEAQELFQGVLFRRDIAR